MFFSETPEQQDALEVCVKLQDCCLTQMIWAGTAHTAHTAAALCGQIETLGSVADKVGRVSCLLCELQKCIKLCLDTDNEPVMNWTKSRLTNIGDFVVDVCYYYI